MSWYFDDNTDENKIGSCNRGSCSSEDGDNLKATRIGKGDYTSQLVIKNVTRQQARSLLCYASSTEKNYCKLDVIGRWNRPNLSFCLRIIFIWFLYLYNKESDLLCFCVHACLQKQ